jgi:hypothetical protein
VPQADIERPAQEGLTGRITVPESKMNPKDMAGELNHERSWQAYQHVQPNFNHLTRLWLMSSVETCGL